MSQIYAFQPRTLTAALVTTALVVLTPPAHALKSFDKTWNLVYPNTLTSTGEADCAVCHGTGNGNLNAYGAALCLALNGNVPLDITPYLRAIEEEDSDGEGSSNWEEIRASAQPGWTLGASNQIYLADVNSCAPIGDPIEVVAMVPIPYDPPVAGEPVADPNGPYAGNVNVPITFDGSGSYDSDGGAIVSFAWDFGDGITGSGMTPQHTYLAAGSYDVTLTVIDNEGKENTNATTVSVVAGAVLDLDIVSLKVTKSQVVGKPVSLQITVENTGSVQGQALATLVGVNGTTEVYRWSLNVYDYLGAGSTSFTFPSYVPRDKGIITWTASIADVDPDPDQTTASTTVK